MRLPRWWRQRREEELEAEIRSHLEMAARDRMERGETAGHARESARREFGNVALVKEITRDMWGLDIARTIVPGPALWLPNVAEKSRLQVDGRLHAGAGHRREHTDLLSVG